MKLHIRTVTLYEMDFCIISVQYPGDLRTISRGYRGMSVVVVLVVFEKLR